jgi:hypothetical protein
MFVCLCMSDMSAVEGKKCRAGEEAVFSSSRLPSLLRDFHARLSLRCHRNRNQRGAGTHLPHWKRYPTASIDACLFESMFSIVLTQKVLYARYYLNTYTMARKTHSTYSPFHSSNRKYSSSKAAEAYYMSTSISLCGAEESVQ